MMETEKFSLQLSVWSNFYFEDKDKEDNCVLRQIVFVLALEYQIFGTPKSTGTLRSVCSFISKWR